MTESITIGIVFSSLNKVKMLAQILGIIDSLEAKIDKLRKVDFDSAVKALEDAKNSDTQKESLVQQARGFFSIATELEEEERLVCAYLGEAACHYFLGDLSNTKRTLIKLAAKDIDILKRIPFSAEDVFTWINPFIDNDNTFFIGRLYSWQINRHTKSFDKQIIIQLTEKINKIENSLEKNSFFNPKEYVLLNRQKLIWQKQKEAWECVQGICSELQT